MSFVWKRPEGRLKSPEQCAREILEVALSMNLDDFAAVLATMCVAQESDFWCPWNAKDPSSHNYPFDSESNDGRSVGYFQQQNGKAGDTVTGSDNWWGPMSQRMDLKKSTHEFLNRLEDNYHDADNSPISASHFIQNVQRSAYPDAYAKHWNRAWDLIDVAKHNQTEPQPQPGAPVTNRPDFNEYEIWSGKSSGRGNTKVDLFLFHTQEGDGNADSLAQWLRDTDKEVSYHYTGSEDYNDHGVTVIDCVDTDEASWSVLSANPRSINFCFAGSRAAWTRDQWMNQAKIIDVACFIAVQDCKKYGFPAKVLKPPYNSDPPGISDHKYVTQWLKDGSHTDVGPNFPWDVVEKSVAKYLSDAPPSPPQPAPPKRFPQDFSDRELLEYVAAQLGSGDPAWKSKGMTMRDKLWSLVKDTP